MGADISDKIFLAHLPSLTSAELERTFENPLLKDLCDRKQQQSQWQRIVHCVLHTENLL